MKTDRVKIVVTVPETHADELRQKMGEAGAGQVGNYSHASFSAKGIGRFEPNASANPAIGSNGEMEAVLEERIEMVCDTGKIQNVVKAIRSTHPYEEPAIDVYPLIDIA